MFRTGDGARTGSGSRPGRPRLVIGGRGNYAEDSLRGDFQRRRRTAISSA